MTIDNRDTPPGKIKIPPRSKPQRNPAETQTNPPTHNQEVFQRQRTEANKRRLEFVGRLEQRLLERGQPSLHLAEQPWESQLTYLNPDQPRWTCVPTSFLNALKRLGIFDPSRDSQQQLIREVNDLFVKGGIQTQPALARLVNARSDRNLRIQTATFEEAIQNLQDRNPVLYGAGAHMRLLTNAGAYYMGEGTDKRLGVGVKMVDPLAIQPKAEIKPIRDILPKETGPDDTVYYVLKVQKPQVRLPSRR